MKTCTGCAKMLPLSEYWPDRSKKHGYTARCKECHRERQRMYRQAHPELDRRRYWDNRDRERERHLVRKYGLTLTGYAELLAKQHGRCAVCRAEEPARRLFDVDHDHKTGKVRGLLCTNCNRMIGHAGDDPVRLMAAARYLVPPLAAEFLRAYMEVAR